MMPHPAFEAIVNGDLAGLQAAIAKEEEIADFHRDKLNKPTGYAAVDLRYADGDSLLCLAVKMGHPDIVQYLLSKNADKQDTLLIAVIECLLESNNSKRSQRINILRMLYI